MTKDERNEAAVNASLGTAAGEVVGRYGSAAGELIKGYQGETAPNGRAVRGLKDIAGSQGDSYARVKQKAGSASEVIYENRTNARNIIDKKTTRVRRTDALGDTNHTEFDHVVTDANGNPILDQHGNYTGTSQMKMRGHYDLDEYIKNKKLKDPNWQPPEHLTQEKLIQISAEENVKKLINKDFSHYERADYLDIPAEQYEYANQFLQDQEKRLTEQMKRLREKGDYETLAKKQDQLRRVKSVRERLRNSGGTESKEAAFAANHPKLHTAKEIHKVSHEAGVKQAKVGAVIGGTVSLSKNLVAYVRGEEKDGKKLALNVVKDTGGAAGLSYVTGYSGTVIKSVMERSGKTVFQNLSKTNMPAMLATAAFEVGKSIKRYLTEEDFDELQLMEELGEKGTGMIAASIGGAIGTALLPGVGTLVGSVVGGMVGYMAGSTLYRSAMDLLKEERLSYEHRLLVEQMAEEAIQAMRKERAELEAMIAKESAVKGRVFAECFEAMEESIADGNHETFVTNLDHLAITFGVELQFANFEEFDEFMSDDDAVFRF